MSSTGGIKLPEIKYINNILYKYTNNICDIVLHCINSKPQKNSLL